MIRRSAILAAVEQYYAGKFDEHGASPQGVDWNSVESQELRFGQLAKLFADDSTAFSINDLGCGYGALAAFLERLGSAASYTGYDLSATMLEHARASFHGRPRIRFQHGLDLNPAEYSVASGVFNVKLDFGDSEWGAYVEETIEDLAAASEGGFAFNMLTSYSDLDRRRQDLYYADPCVVFDTCKKRYSRNVALLHDYGLWEFTVIVRLAQ